MNPVAMMIEMHSCPGFNAAANCSNLTIFVMVLHKLQI